MLQTVLFWAVIVFSFSLLLGCGSSKKHKEKESYENTVKTEIDSSSSSSVKTDDKVKEENKVSEELSEEVLDVELKDGEELEITNYDSKGNKTGSTKYSGSGVAKKTTGTKKTQTSAIKETNTKTDSSAQLASSTRTYASEASKKAIVKVDKKGFSFCVYLFWIGLVIIALVLWYLNKRFSWVFKLTNLFKKQFGI